MKKSTKLPVGIFIIVFLMMNQFANAQWQKKASGFTIPQSTVYELIAVGNNVAWGISGPTVNSFNNGPFHEFTRTIDGGKHWTAGSITDFPEFTLVGIAPLSATLCYGSLANFDNGMTKVVKTTDGGITWTEVLSYDYGQPFSFFADIYFFNANEGLIYGDPSDGYFTIFTTQDGGSHWTRVPQANMPVPLTDEFSYVFSAEGIGDTFWTVSSSGRIWKSLDKGLHWNAIETEQTSIEFSNLKMRDALHGLWGVHGELYRTDDGGVTWEEVEYSGTWFTNDLAYVPGTLSTYVSTGAQDFPGYAPSNSLHGIGSSYSTDDGNTWITIDTAVEHISLAMVNEYTGFTGGVNTNASAGIFRFNGSALGYSCGNNLTSICHRGHTICVANSSIENHLSMGDHLGACVPGYAINNKLSFENSETNKEFAVHPNPLSNSTTISFSIIQTGKVSLKIFDMNGRLLATLVNEEMKAGVHEINWNTKNAGGKPVPSGVYLLRIEAGDFIDTRKLSVIK